MPFPVVKVCANLTQVFDSLLCLIPSSLQAYNYTYVNNKNDRFKKKNFQML